MKPLQAGFTGNTVCTTCGTLIKTGSPGQPKDIPWNCEMGRSPPVPRLVIPVIITVFPAIRSL